jgi:hypothetical protein
MDGVTEMRGFYERGGFRALHDHIRMTCAPPPAQADPELVDLAELPFAEIEALDERDFGAPRTAFLRRWIEPEGGLALGLHDGARLRGMGVARQCEEGFKIGPLFAEDGAVAERIFVALGAVGAPLTIDVPDRNPAAIALAERHGAREIFRCTRMYLGDPPPIDWSEVFAVTSLELG